MSATVGKKTKCWQMYDTLVHVLEAKVPELREIGAPYIERETGGQRKLVFYIRRCPVPIEGDSLSTHYYEVHVGSGGQDEFPEAWYKFYVHERLRRVLVGDKLVPVDELRRTDAWKAEWEERR
jgi:hypothetical protein